MACEGYDLVAYLKMVRCHLSCLVEDHDTQSDQKKNNADIQKKYRDCPNDEQASGGSPTRRSSPACFRLDANECADTLIAISVRVHSTERDVLLHSCADREESIEQSAVPTGRRTGWEVVEILPS